MKVQAPPVDGQQWFNADFSSWDDLTGRTVVLVFWSLGDEASLTRLQQVQLLDQRLNDLTCIGVHTPRLPYEDDPENVRSVISQLGISIPVVHDPEYVTWDRYNPEGWPTTIVISDRGKVLGAQAGVDYFDTLEEAVSLSVNVAKRRRLDRPAPPGIPRTAATPLPPASGLAFPTCVQRLGTTAVLIVDSGHDRLVIAEWLPEQATLIQKATIDGFQRPYGATVDPNGGKKIYISEPSTGSVISYDRRSGEKITLSRGLLRPTGMIIDRDGSLVIADAAAEQLLRIVRPDDPSHMDMGLIAGTGTSGAEDGLSSIASLCQPVALARTEAGLAFCDAGTSSLRLLTDSGKITTIIGQDGEWGNVDGPAHQARFQRLGHLTILNDGSIMLVDTGNNRLCRLSKRRLKTFGPGDLNRPSGACLMPSGHLLVADTGNNRIVAIDPDLKNSRQVAVEGFEFSPPPAPSQQAEPTRDEEPKKIEGLAGEEVVIEYPAPASGPWLVSVQSEPPWLLAEPVVVERASSAGQIRVTLGLAGQGSLTVRSELMRDATISEFTRAELTVGEA